MLCFPSLYVCSRDFLFFLGGVPITGIFTGSFGSPASLDLVCVFHLPIYRIHGVVSLAHQEDRRDDSTGLE